MVGGVGRGAVRGAEAGDVGWDGRCAVWSVDDVGGRAVLSARGGAMIRIRVGGRWVTGKTCGEAVDAMKRASIFTALLSRERYMEQVAKRAMGVAGVTVRTSDPCAFLDDLRVGGVMAVEGDLTGQE